MSAPPSASPLFGPPVVSRAFADGPCPCCGGALHAQRIEGADAASSVSTRYTIAPGDSFLGRLGNGDPTDYVRVNLVAGQAYTFTLQGRGQAALDDPLLRLLDSSGRSLAVNDDADGSRDARLSYTATQTGSFVLVADSYRSAGSGDYTLAASTGRGVTTGGTWTMPQIADYLTDGFWEDRGAARHSYDVAPGGRLTCDLTDLSAAEAQVARQALDAWTQVTGIRFDTGSRAGTGAQIRFTNDDQRGAYAQATDGFGTTVTHSMINIPQNWAEGPLAGWASYFYQSYLHEIGHALGLGHAGNYNGSATYGIDNTYANDSWQASVMSYFSQDDNPAVNASYGFAVTPMIADILAVQALYGSWGGAQAGDSVWGVGATVGGALGQAMRMLTAGQAVTMTILDQSGTDTLRVTNDTAAQRIDLRPGSICDLYGRTGNLSIAADTVIENLQCGSGSDRVTGNDAGNWLIGNGGLDTLSGLGGNDTLEGGAGNDRLLGGTGDDLFILTDRGDVVVEAADEGTDRVRASFSYQIGSGVEALLLIHSLARSGAGNGVANTLAGNRADNLLSGGAGKDTLFGLDGNDTLDGGTGTDRLVGGLGNDLYLRDGTDAVVEAADGGTDTVRSSSSYTLDLHVERGELTGTANTALTGNAASNLLTGNGGANILTGGGGRDTMTGGAGADHFIFAATAPGGRITDFQDDLDTLRISGGTADQILASARDTAEGVELRLQGGVLAIAGVDLDGLRDDLVFV